MTENEGKPDFIGRLENIERFQRESLRYRIKRELLDAQHTREVLQMQRRLDQIQACLQSIKIDTSKDRGFAAGVAFVIGAITTFIAVFYDRLTDTFGG